MKGEGPPKLSSHSPNMVLTLFYVLMAAMNLGNQNAHHLDHIGQWLHNYM